MKPYEIDTDALLPCERVAVNDGKLLHVEIASPHHLHAIIAEGDSGGDEWTWGGVPQSETAEALRTGIAPAIYADAYAAERDQWREKEAALQAALPSRKRRRTRSDWGDEFDASAWVGGDPRCWETVKRGKMRPSITIGMQGGMSCENGAAEFAEKTGVAVACARALDSAGYSVRVVAAWSAAKVPTKHGRKIAWCLWSTVAKSYADPLDEGNLLSLGVQGVLRAGMIGHRRGRWTAVAGASSPYGYPRTPAPMVSEAVGVDLWIGRTWEASESATDEGATVVEALRTGGMNRG